MKKLFKITAFLWCANFLFYTPSVLAEEIKLSYSYVSPYDKGGKLTLHNHSAEDVLVTKLEFDVNADFLVDDSNKPGEKKCNAWGSLLPGHAECSAVENEDKTTLHYTIAAPDEGIMIAAGQSAVLDYGYTATRGLIQLGMNPVKVRATIDGSSLSKMVPLEGMCEGTACNDPTPGKRIVGYYTNWDMYARKYQASDIPIQKANTIIYAFIGYNTQGDIHSLDINSDSKQVPVIAQMLKRYPYLRAFISFGGWTLSKDFPALAANAVTRDNFAKNAVAVMKQFQFNGVDIDWEYPTKADSANFVALLKALRAELDKQAKIDSDIAGKPVKYYLTIAAAAGKDKIEWVNTAQWKELVSILDEVNLMTYDYHGAWDNSSNFQAAMEIDKQHSPHRHNEPLKHYSVTKAVAIFKSLGFKPEQIILGIPAYGRMVTLNNGSGGTYGLYRDITPNSPPQGEFDKDGVFNYKCIVDRTSCVDKLSSSLLQNLKLVDFEENSFGQHAKTPWGYSETAFLTYDDAKSTAYKTAWAKQQGLGGIMFWTFSGDLPVTNDKSLIFQVHKTLTE